jgi:2-keto-3-deoxy-L-rhamnonate aldolase RhmA
MICPSIESLEGLENVEEIAAVEGIDMICAAAPYVMAMTRRLRRERDCREEPANIFQFPE